MNRLEMIKKAMERIILEMDKIGVRELSANVNLSNGNHYTYNIEKARILSQ